MTSAIVGAFLISLIGAGCVWIGGIVGYRRGYLAGVSDCKKKLPEIASLAAEEVVKNWSLH